MISEPASSNQVHAGRSTWASFSRDRMYRYTLGRVWDRSLPRCCFVMLNPSTADVRTLDPTCTRARGFAERLGCGSLEVVNCFALRSTDPKGLRRVADPVGPANDRAIARAAGRANIVVAAWGNHASLGERSARVRAILAAWSATRPICFGLTGTNEPKHPLYLPGSAACEPLG